MGKASEARIVRRIITSGMLIASCLLVVACGKRDSKGPEGKLAQLRQELESPDLATRKTAIQKLGQLGHAAAAATPQLVAILTDSELRYPAIAALGRIGKAAVPALVDALQDPKLGAPSREALEVLGEPILPDLVRMMKGRSLPGQKVLVDVMLSLGAASASALTEMAENEELWPAVGYGLKKIRVEYHLATLIALHRVSEKARRFVIPRMWQEKPVPGPTPMQLVGELGAEDEKTRNGAAMALAAMGPRALDVLLSALQYEKMTPSATYALRLMGKGIVEKLQELSKKERHAAVRPRVRELIEELRKD